MYENGELNTTQRQFFLPQGAEELYDLSVDPREQSNVAAAHPEIIKRVLEIFRTEHVEAEIQQFNLPVW